MKSLIHFILFFIFKKWILLSFHGFSKAWKQHSDITWNPHHHIADIMQQHSSFWTKLWCVADFTITFGPKTRVLLHDIGDVMMSPLGDVTALSFQAFAGGGKELGWQP